LIVLLIYRLVVLHQPQVDLGSILTGFGDVVLEEGDLVVVTEVLQKVLKGLFVDVSLN
jgi:hypothetical protein